MTFLDCDLSSLKCLHQFKSRRELDIESIWISESIENPTWELTWWLQLIFLAAVTPIMHDFYNFDLASPDYLYQFNSFLKVNLGACISSAFHFLNSVGTHSKMTTFKWDSLVAFMDIAFSVASSVQNWFVQNLSLFGALLFFLGMKNSAFRQMARKKQPIKAKTL